MRVLVITPFYALDLGPSAALYEMLCEDLARLGCRVSVISALPHYPTGSVPKKFGGRVVWREKRNGVDVTRVWVPSVNRARLGLRLLSFLCYQILASAVGLRRNYDVVITSNPALEVMLPFLVLGWLRRKPIIYSVHEIYPDIGIKLGIFHHRPVIRFVDWMEGFCCRSAAYIRVLSKGYKKTLEARGVPSSKLVVISDWIDTDFIRPLSRRNAFSTQWGLDNCFVVLYAGNLGPTQGLEQVVEAARLLASEPSIRFVFVGEGAAKKDLQESVGQSGLANIQFIPFQAREVLPLILASADVSLLTLKRGLATDSVPSKLYSILASGRPVIACADEGADICDLRAGQFGVCVEPENPQALAAAISSLFQDESYRHQLGANGRAYAVANHQTAVAAQKFHTLICPPGQRKTGPGTKHSRDGETISNETA